MHSVQLFEMATRYACGVIWEAKEKTGSGTGAALRLGLTGIVAAVTVHLAHHTP